MKKIFIFLANLVAISTFAQPIVVNTTQYTPAQLVSDVLVNSPCATVSNVTAVTGSNFGSTNGIGYFTNTNPTFDMQSGIILSTGDALSAPGPENGIQSNGQTTWPADTQLTNYINQVLQTPNAIFLNATILEFDFVPLTNEISFAFIFASEEYGQFQCDYSDSFAFFLTDMETNTTNNLALVPNTNDPISVVTVRDSQHNGSCESRNSQYFGSYNQNSTTSAINFRGQTVKMVAQSDVVPGRSYHIKLVIQDRTDRSYDSAVFLEAGSFSIGEPDLGGDKLIAENKAICGGGTTLLDTGLSDDDFNFQWSKNGVIIPGATQHDYTVTAPGEYSVEISGGPCTLNPQPVVIEFYPDIDIVNAPNNLEACNAAGDFTTFDLTDAEQNVLDPSLTASFEYYLTEQGAENATDADKITNPTAYEKENNGQPQTIWMRIKLDGTGCFTVEPFEIETITCTINPNNLLDIHKCSNDANVFFDFSNYKNIAYNGNPNYAVTFYHSFDDAELGNNPIPEAEWNNYQGTNGEEIFVKIARITNPDERVVISFHLFIHPIPEGITTVPISACELGLGTNNATFDLELVSNHIAEQNSALISSYYASEALAESGLESDRLPEDYTSSAGTIYVRAENPVTGCYVVLPQELVVVPAPVANVPTPIVLCDKFNDGREVFNLVSRENEIAGNPVPAGVQVSYHETETDAALRQNLIATPDAYENIVLHNQTVYVRVGYPNSSCYKIVPLELELKPTPKIVYRTSITLCDQGNNGFEFFDLTSVSSEILNGLSPSDYTLSYHTSKEHAELGTPSIGNPSSFNNLIVNQVFVRVTDNTSGCYSIATIRLDVKGVPVVPTVVPTYELCDTNHDGYETFQLDTRIPSIVGNQEGLNVTFYSNEADAENASNALPYTYQNAVLNVQTLYVRVTNSSSGCYAITTMDIRVNPNPQITVPNTPYAICNLGGTGGFGTINLNDYGNELVAGTGFTVSYYETQEQAINGIDAIANPANYNNLEASNPVIWLRIVNQTSGCFSVYPITFALVTAPNMPLTFDELTACDTLGNTQDGLGVIDLTVQEASILAANNGSLSGFTVHYYEKEADAEAGVNWIGNPSAYQNTSNPQTIWVSIENDSNPTSCRRIRSFEIQINKPTKLTNPSPISICESALPNEGHESFDLTIRELSILGNVQTYGITFEYYLSEQDRNNGVNAITNPEDYVSTSSNQIIYIKVINEHGCESFTSLQLRVVPLPEVEESPEGLEACETTYGSGQASFNLKDSEAEVGKEIPNLLFTYYKTQSGAENEEAAAEINTPEAYVSGSGFVYVRVRNVAAQSCAVIVKLPLQVHGLPKLGNLTPMLACLEGSTGFHEFNLHDKDAEVLAGQSASDYIIKYYTSENNARQDANPIPYIYTNVVQQQQDIYVRIEDKETGCYQVGHFILRVEEEVKAFEPSQELTVFCEKDFINDGSTPADLTVMDAEIMGTQVATPTAVRYYTSSGTLIADPTNYTITNGEELIAEVYVNQPGFLCTAQVLVKVSTKDGPEIADIADGVICFNYRDSNENIQVYLMDTGLPATDDYKYEWTLNGNPVGENSPTYEAKTAGTYVVKVTYLPTGCENQRTITVVEGSPIAIDEIRQSQSFEESTAIEIVATAGAGVELEYQLDGGEWQDSPIYDPLTPGEHVVKVRIKGDTVDCPAVEIIQILSHPQYFTPNGDGYNDTWNITALKGQPDARVYIFDRYGKLLKELSPSGPGWDGTLNGSPMPSSDYWFKVRYVDPQTGLEKEATGHFTLKR